MAQDRHGGDVYSAERQANHTLARLIDFSASINPLGPSPRVRRVMGSALTRAVHYPDPDCFALRQALASRYGHRASQFLIGNGSIELIHLLPRGLRIRHALIVGPTFSEYEEATRKSGGHVTYIHAQRASQYGPPVEKVLAALQQFGRKRPTRKKIDAVFLCNPNSPTAQVLRREEVVQVVRATAERNVWLVVDETFMEYCPVHSVMSLVGRYPRLVLLRSFTKFYALPGFRIGYLAATRGVVECLRTYRPPWSVNTLAQEAARAALADTGHAWRSLEFMQIERRRLTRWLRSVPGITVYSSAVNFLLVELPRSTKATWLTSKLRQQGLLIRDCSTIRGLNPRTVRVAVRTTAQNRRLLASFQSLIRQ